MTDLQKAKMILEIVCDEFDQRLLDVKGKINYRAYVVPRHFSMKYIREFTNLSSTQTGLIFSRDHATVLNAENNVENLINYNGYRAQDSKMREKILRRLYPNKKLNDLRTRRHRYHFRAMFKRSRVKISPYNQRNP